MIDYCFSASLLQGGLRQQYFLSTVFNLVAEQKIPGQDRSFSKFIPPSSIQAAANDACIEALIHHHQGHGIVIAQFCKARYGLTLRLAHCQHSLT